MLNIIIGSIIGSFIGNILGNIAIYFYVMYKGKKNVRTY